jgi:hypothetical protein
MKIPWLILIGFFLLPGSALAGSEHAFGQAAGNCGGVWRLPDTGQTVHYSTAPGDDSDYRPVAVQPKYTVLNPVGVSSVTVDNITGLMWVTNSNDAGIGGPYTWDSALTACEGLTYATYTDWRLSNIKELQSIVDYSRQSPAINTLYFINTQPNDYWSSTTFMPVTANAWSVVFSHGGMNASSKTNTYSIRCVRVGL